MFPAVACKLVGDRYVKGSRICVLLYISLDFKVVEIEFAVHVCSCKSAQMNDFIRDVRVLAWET